MLYLYLIWALFYINSAVQTFLNLFGNSTTRTASQNWTEGPESLPLHFWNAPQIWKDQPCQIHLQTPDKHCKSLAITLSEKHQSYHHWSNSKTLRHWNCRQNLNWPWPNLCHTVRGTKWLLGRALSDLRVRRRISAPLQNCGAEGTSCSAPALQQSGAGDSSQGKTSEAMLAVPLLILLWENNQTPLSIQAKWITKNFWVSKCILDGPYSVIENEHGHNHEHFRSKVI